MKFLCLCNKLAVWSYMPGGEYGYFCDDCVPRGCSCNFELKPGALEDSENPNDYQEPTDKLGRKFPCCEYFFDEEGFVVNQDELDFFDAKNTKYIIKSTYPRMNSGVSYSANL